MTSVFSSFNAASPVPIGNSTPNAGNFTVLTASYVVSDIVTQVSPLTGATVSAGVTKANETLFINPAGTLTALTVTLPTAANSRVGQIVRVFISQIVVSLTISVSGGGVVIGSALDASIANASGAFLCVSTSGSGTWAMIYPQS